MSQASAGHGGSPADGVVDIAVGGDAAVLHLGDEVAVLLVCPGGGDAVGAGHLRDQIAVGQASVFKVPGWRGDFAQAAVSIVIVCVIGDAPDGQAKSPAFHA